jgi:transcriptional regulator with XRE-family HTH domain
MQEVRRLRQSKGWNQTELAYHAGLAPSVISQIETGKRDPTAGTLKKLAKALGVDVPDLFPKAQSPLPDFDDRQRRDYPPPFVTDALIPFIGLCERLVDNPSDPEVRYAALACYDAADAIGREIVEAFEASGLPEKWDRGTATGEDIAPWLKANEEREAVQDRLRRIAGKGYEYYRQSVNADARKVDELAERRKKRTTLSVPRYGHRDHA